MGDPQVPPGGTASPEPQHCECRPLSRMVRCSHGPPRSRRALARRTALSTRRHCLNPLRKFSFPTCREVASPVGHEDKRPVSIRDDPAQMCWGQDLHPGSLSCRYGSSEVQTMRNSWCPCCPQNSYYGEGIAAEPTPRT